MTNTQRKDAIKFLGMLMTDCQQQRDDHAWRKCPRCLAMDQIEKRDNLAMKLFAVAIEALNDATPRT
jgi:hypothetical protein